MTRGRNLVIALIATFLLLGASELLAHLSVANDAAGALLSNGGAAHPLAFVLAAAYALTRLAGTAMVCIAAALTAAYATRRALDRRAPPPTQPKNRRREVPSGDHR